MPKIALHGLALKLRQCDCGIAHGLMSSAKKQVMLAWTMCYDSCDSAASGSVSCRYNVSSGISAECCVDCLVN